MPELPEVEIVKEGLKKVFKPEVLIDEIVFRRKNLRSLLPYKEIKRVLGQPVTSIERRAKYIIMNIGGAECLVSHLGMTGTWRVELSDKKLKVHDHIVMRLSDKRFLVYNDPRRFGTFDILSKEQFSRDKRFSQLGPEPLSDDFSLDYFFKKSRNKKVPIKSFIMDQRVVVGVGNIYACEALYEAQISPFVLAGKLKTEQIETLIKSIQDILKKSIESGGSSISDYAQVDEKKGSYQDNHKVYGRDGQTCHKCRAIIEVKVISGRSTFWCVKCQKTPRKTSNERHKNVSRKNLQKASRITRSRRKHS